MTAREFCRMVEKEKGKVSPEKYGEYVLERYSEPTCMVKLCPIDNMTVIPEQPAVVEVEAEPEPEAP
jgi:hypothetical protein